MAEGKNLVGVDIGASSIKVVQLKESRKKLQVIRWGWAPLPPQTIIDGHVMNSGAVTETLARIFHDGKIQQRDVAIGVYGQSVIVRKITVPMMTPGELDEQIHWEAEQHIPFDIKLMSIDYEVLRRRPEAGQMDLLARGREEGRDQRLRRDPAARPSSARPSSTSTPSPSRTSSSTSTASRRTRTIALLNLGAAVSSLNIVSKGVSAFTREITNAGNSITEEIRKALSCSYEQAEAYKHGGGETQIVPQEVTAIINQACQALAGEIQRSLDFYLATSGEPEIGRIYVSGGSAYLAPLVQAIEKRARVPVQIFDPMVNLSVDPKFVNEAQLRGDGGAAGRGPRALAPVRQGEAAMVRINLLPDRRGQAGRRARPRSNRGSSGSSGCSARPSPPSSSASSSRRSKESELAEILADNGVHPGPDRRHRQADLRSPADHRAPQGAPRSRGRDPEARSRRARGRPRRCSSSRAS